MTFLTPLFALLALLAIPILLLYMLKLRRQEVKVSSTLLWQMLIEDRQANVPWQKLRRNLLLFVQLLILAALIFALLRPALPSDTIGNAEVIVVLDASASMLATDVTPTRFSAAKDEVERIIANLPPKSELTLIEVSAQPRILLSHSANKQEMRRALASAQASASEADWGTAVALANSAITKPDHILVLLSDGGLGELSLPLYAENIRYLPIGESDANLGVAAFSVNANQGTGELFIKVRNYGYTQNSAILSIYRDNELLQAENITLAAGSEEIQIIPDLPLSAANYRAQLTSENDPYPLDDAAFVAFHPSASQRILLVSEGNFFLEQFLAALPNAEAYQMLPSDAGIPAAGYTTTIYDGFFPDSLPDGSILLINPPPNPLMDVGLATDQIGELTIPENPLTNYTNFERVSVLRAKSIPAPLWADVLVDSDAGALVFVGETQSRRVAVIAFDLLDSDLPLQVAFPILFSKLLDYLNPPAIYDAPQGFQVGEAVTLHPSPDVDELRITAPDGTEFELTVDEQGATFLDTDQVGLYTITSLPNGAEERFAVNQFSSLESNITPQENLSIISSEQENRTTEKTGLREFWSYAALLTIALLMWEWWLYHRRSRVRFRPSPSALSQRERGLSSFSPWEKVRMRVKRGKK
jgi:Ca-activated chloride channel family protein